MQAMIKDAVRLFLDHKIGRRDLMKRIMQAGVSAGGAASILSQLTVSPAQAATTEGDSEAPEAGRILENMTGGEVTAEFLMDWEIPYVFGLAGSEEVGFLDALVDRTKLQYTTCLHENAAMAMADGFSRSTGRTSFVQLHSIAGTAYAFGQLAGSFKDHVPVVVAAGRQSTNFRGEDGFLEAPGLTEIPHGYTRWTWDVMNGVTIPEVMRRAFLLAEAPPGGPAFVTFSKDIWEGRVASAEILPRSRSRVSADVAPDEAHVKGIVDRLLAADKPVLFLGNECIRYEISDTVAAISEAIGAGVMFSVKIPCVFPTTHPNFVGEVLDDPAYLEDIDCFWSLGGHMFKLFNRPKAPLLKRSATIMHTSLVETDVGRNYPVDLAAVASIKATSEAVLAELKRRDLSSSAIAERKRRLAAYTAGRREAFMAAAKAEWNAKPIATSRLMLELNAVIGKSAYIVSELISSDAYPRRYLDFDHRQPASERRRNFYTTSGVLGWGVAAAIGTKIGNPDKEVWCLTADGCFNFGCQALWTAARYEVPIGVVVFNNGQYQANRDNQNHYKGRMYQTGKYIGVDLGHPDIDYVSLAAAYGVKGERVEDPGKLAAALKRCRRAMQDGRPYLVDVKIEKRFAGKESDWHDFFSVARKLPRQS